GVLQAGLPVGLGEGVGKVVVVVAEVLLVHVVVELGAGDGRLGHAGVGAGLVQGHGIEGGEHTHVRQDGQVVFGVAVAVGGHVHHQADVEVGTAVQHGLGILGDLGAQLVVGAVVGVVDGVEVADAQAAAAAHALIVVNGSLVLLVEG